MGGEDIKAEDNRTKKDDRKEEGWEKGEKDFLRKMLWLSHHVSKKQKATEDRRSKLLIEVNSVQCLLLYSAFLGKQWKQNNTSGHLVSQYK